MPPSKVFTATGKSIPSWLRGDNTVLQSKVFNISFPGGMELDFNWIYHLLLCTCKSSPNTSRAKSEKQKEELENFGGKGFLCLFTHRAQEDGEDFDLELDTWMGRVWRSRSCIEDLRDLHLEYSGVWGLHYRKFKNDQPRPCERCIMLKVHSCSYHSNTHKICDIEIHQTTSSNVKTPPRPPARLSRTVEASCTLSPAPFLT